MGEGVYFTKRKAVFLCVPILKVSDGSVSSDFSIDYGKDGVSVLGEVQLKIVFLRENLGSIRLGRSVDKSP